MSLREKKLNQNFLWICASTHYVLHNYKVSGNSVKRFQRSCANKKNRTDGLTDWLTDGSKTLFPPQLVAWGIKIVQGCINFCVRFQKCIKSNIEKKGRCGISRNKTATAPDDHTMFCLFDDKMIIHKRFWLTFNNQ